MIYIILIDEQIVLATNNKNEVFSFLNKAIERREQNKEISVILQIWKNNKMIKRIDCKKKNQKIIHQFFNEIETDSAFLRTRIIQILEEYDSTNPTILSLIQYLQNRENII